MRSTSFNSNKSGPQDVDGKEYIDFIGMFSAVNTGHCHPHIQRAVVEQLNKGMIGPVRKYASSHLADLRCCQKLHW